MARVLVVEDDAAMCRLLALHLESETHDVITAASGEDGLQMAIDARPDLILSDIRLPGIDGLEMLAQVRADRRTAAIPCIILAEGDEGELRTRSRTLRVAEFLVKPFNRERLLKAVSRQTHRRRTRRALEEPAAEPADHMETMAMAADYTAAPAHGAAPARDAVARAVEGTVSFFAIRDFNRIGEAIGEDRQIELLNAFQENVRDVVAKNAGWIVKTIEGGFIAMFEDGATSGVDHAERAAKTALLCVLALHRFGPWISARVGNGNTPALAAVAGLHSGPVSVCSLYGGKTGGKAERTIIGDTVNVASRLQSQAGDLGWSIVASETTMKRAGARFGSGRRSQVTVTGRRTPLDIVEGGALRPRPGSEGSDSAFYAEVAGALAANTRLIDAQNAIRQPAAAGSDRPGAAVPRVREAAAPARAAAVATAAPAEAVAPIEVPGYAILRKVGEGGVAQVYLARHERSGEERVLKLVRLGDGDDADIGLRFVQEYALLAQTAHPNVARVYQHGYEAAYAYLAMEYFPGGDLRGQMRAAHEPAAAVAALLQVAAGIAAVHRRGVVHRDLKPDNVMIRADGSLAIADFGVAKKVADAHGPTQHGEVVGTPYYLSPEQVLGTPADHRADIYSMGVMFYEMLTGLRAYTADSAMGLMYQHAQSPVPVLPDPLARFQPLLERMMDKERDRRFASALEIVDFVRHHALA
ncbi:MAG: protein kinase [Burkholderiales bacterium]|nr:protein kinase [Burkholderiales bacterium]